ncbi:reverse transcriptase/ribonuclease h/methyltransferase [Plakobranchus ocellatus]|uniref:Reverse transcriptase/ribonuclease h/methyltransferase n=1 Tax=Plakobranchus ocellatus TaxID=259542 RepID=A0AAV4DCL7_9GAST|nr:reverse transcriptase/ribonuclease h/methyltransferase [Plakobranchus ocellatus]
MGSLGTSQDGSSLPFLRYRIVCFSSSRHPPHPSQETKTPCMQGVGDRLRQQGFSAKATEVMLDSWRPDTKKVYASYITKWQRHAAAIKVDITATVNFLADLYEKGASHSALCIARSTLSSYVDIQDLGKCSCVRRFLKGVYEQQPSLPM